METTLSTLRITVVHRMAFMRPIKSMLKFQPRVWLMVDLVKYSKERWGNGGFSRRGSNG